MDHSEKLCLQWNDFQENLNLAFKELRNDIDLSDVTLVSDDGRKVEAHKIVLAASSPFFMTLLKSSKNTHPLIYLRGVKEETLLAMTDFLYNGEANVFQENLDSFLALAEEFKLKGLTGSDQSQRDKNCFTSGLHYSTSPAKEEEKDYRSQGGNLKKVDGESQLWSGSGSSSAMQVANPNNQVVSVELNQLDEQIKSMIEHTGKSMTVGSRKRELFSCKVCGKEGQLADINRHIEAIHITGVVHTCDKCGKTSRSKRGLTLHKYKEHRA